MGERFLVLFRSDLFSFLNLYSYGLNERRGRKQTLSGFIAKPTVKSLCCFQHKKV